MTIICDTWLTDTHDFYTVVETNKETFEVHHINLDSKNPVFNPNKHGLLGLSSPTCSLPFKDTNGKQIDKIHIRGSSSKEKIDLNKQLMIFFKLETELWGWNSNKFERISDKAYNVYYLSDDVFFFMETEEIPVGDKKVKQSTIFKVECLFGSYKVSKVYMDQN